MPRRVALALIVLLSAGGCVPPLPQNVGREYEPGRFVVRELDGARLFAEAELPDGWWLEVERNGVAAVGGYLSDNLGESRALVAVLPGASTFFEHGMVEKARSYHDVFSAELRRGGYATWTLVVRECGTPYGQGDLDDVLAALTWLEGDAIRAELGAERVYVVGYSSGGTIALLANLRRRVDGVVVISGLTRPDEIETLWPLVNLVVNLYPENAGICQMRSTLETYGLPGAPGWSDMDAVAQVARLKSPMLVVHGVRDPVHPVSGARALQRAYEAAVARGTALPPVEFLYLADAGHLEPPEREDTIEAILAFFARNEIE